MYRAYSAGYRWKTRFKGDRLDNPDSYVVFITKRDILGGGLSLYHVKRTIEETNQYFGKDGNDSRTDCFGSNGQ